MRKLISPIISVSELVSLQKTVPVILLDSRYGDALASYEKSHLEGALFVDLDKDLADIKKDVSQGGRHPLPTISHFVSVLNNWGIDNQSHVVIYDNAGGAFASRLWWMLRSIGHEKVQVLDGGFENAVKNGFPTNSNKKTNIEKSNYIAESWNWPMADINTVEKEIDAKSSTVIDVRSNTRYRGEFEPLDLIAGHIPGAINLPFSENLNSEGLFLSAEILAQKYAEIAKSNLDSNVIVHCGSGVTACHTILAMDIAELEIPTLYVGSWSEWSRNNKTIGTDLMRNTNQSYFIQSSERLTYRKLTKDDTESWGDFFENNDRLHFLGIDGSKGKKVLAEEWVAKQEGRYLNEGLGLLAVIDKETGALLGACGLLPRAIQNKYELEVGYSFLPQYWGKGYATEAANQMREFGLENNMANRIISIIHVDNEDSMKVARRNNMKALFNDSYMGMPVTIFGTSGN
jgi:thiosulfate/3-mercaptopyruvate sulfurtransferase